MKRVALLLLVSLLALAPILGMAASYDIATVNNQRASDRLHLRTSPNASAPSLGKYYSGVMVEVLEYTNSTWVRVNIAGVKGYMMREYLAFGASAWRVDAAMPVMRVSMSSASDGLNLRESYSTDARSLGEYANSTLVTVLGIAGDDWMHVRIGGDTYLGLGGVTGYMMSKFLVSANTAYQPSQPAVSGYSTAVVNNPNPADRLHLRASASSDAESLCKYYNGVTVSILYDTYDEYVKVSVAGETGYMRRKYLAFGSAAYSVASAMPNMQVYSSNGGGLNLRRSASTRSDTLRTYPQGTYVTVLGIVNDDWLHVNVDNQTGYMASEFLIPAGSQPGTTHGAGSDAAVVNNPNPEDRLNLRANTSEDADSYGKYYNGVEVKILDYTNDTWVKVRIGEAIGYMMRKYLAFGNAASSVISAIPQMNVVSGYYNREPMYLYRDISKTSASIAIAAGTSMEVLGLVRHDLLHVRVYSYNNQYFRVTQDGYFETKYLEGAAYGYDTRATVRSGGARLYKNPDTNSGYSVLSNGETVRVLIKDTNYCFVRTDNDAGYVVTDNLRF